MNSPPLKLQATILALALPTLMLRADDRRDFIVKGATIEKVATGYQFTEGPAADRDGDIWFTDIPNSTIIRFDTSKQKAVVEHEDTEGANGLMFDRKNRLVACAGGRREVVRYDHDGSQTILAKNFGKKRFNSPNDLVLDGKGGFYFTDPAYFNTDDRDIEVEGVYYVDREEQIIRVIDDMKRPNGLILSPDGRTLYVSDIGAKIIYAYHVNTDGTLADNRHFADADGGADGMTVDEKGNLYAACSSGIQIWDPKGNELPTITVPDRPANCAFGGPNHRTLYITARRSLYRIKLNVTGFERWKDQEHR